MNELKLHAERVVLGADALRLAPARVEIRDGVIAAVEEGGPGPDDQRLGDMILAPAFVNAHTHLALHACRGLASAEWLRGNLVEDLFYRVEAHLLPEDVEAFARVAALDSLLAGVGIVFDHYYHAASTARAMRDCGLAGLVSPTLQDLGGPGAGQVDEALGAIRELAGPGWRRAGILPAPGPHATDTVSADLWRRALHLAEELDLVVHAHVAQSAEEAHRCLERHGCSPIAWLEREGLLESPVRQLLVHALYVDRADLARLDPARHVLGACPYSQMQFGFPAPLAEWEQAGLDWFVGTDTGASNDGMDVQKELRAIFGLPASAVTWSQARGALADRLDAARVEEVEALRRRADGSALRDPQSLLSRIWSRPGRWAPGLRAGVIEVGARAQLLVIDPDHPALWPGTESWRGLALGGLVPAISGVIAGGTWVGEPGRPEACLELPEVREWIAEATTRHRALLARAGLA